jgi:hypothetical protein
MSPDTPVLEVELARELHDHAAGTPNPLSICNKLIIYLIYCC